MLARDRGRAADSSLRPMAAVVEGGARSPLAALSVNQLLHARRAREVERFLNRNLLILVRVGRLIAALG